MSSDIFDFWNYSDILASKFLSIILSLGPSTNNNFPPFSCGTSIFCWNRNPPHVCKSTQTWLMDKAKKMVSSHPCTTQEAEWTASCNKSYRNPTGNQWTNACGRKIYYPWSSSSFWDFWSSCNYYRLYLRFSYDSSFWGNCIKNYLSPIFWYSRT